MWPISLPDELLQVLPAELDAAAACRLSQVDKAMQHWILLHARDRVYAWRHASAWLMLCKRAKVRVLHRRAGQVPRLQRGRCVLVRHTALALAPTACSWDRSLLGHSHS